MPNVKAILLAVLKGAACLFVRSRLDNVVSPPSTFTPPSVITPTVGRVVWFFPADRAPSDQPLPALVAHVWSDTVVNLAIFDASGNPVPNPPTSVPLLSASSVPPGGGPYCTWMPYQQGQAAKTDALAKQLAARS
ncbi:hypothetical protein GobsT_37140 [Gemmata obscuriglobus]|uniref:Uncharacterized protein n=1 Tax=Gemmata obscuriglobus TaxID=114 RepID=A0A2Z3H382_9BACT|nr:hypothetical protein [Gemmata obscuriglobus]AWM38177.1 hypothetical protein C1280_15080 [Gemmata obscuriglobus]QEG28925.1 hypothetical protein GobsT_37140 [Gemmata obscuriglobus]VTS07425.1 Uncharacterized protein OS=Pseudomonas aeruginosa VRFPA03 GN=M770_13480 PE=4 SV=1 [Gemmata obscuriglobus UQM 2246]